MNGLNSPPASKSDSVGSITLKTNEEIQTIGISTDQEQKSADLRFAADHSTFGGVSGTKMLDSYRTFFLYNAHFFNQGLSMVSVH